MSLLYSLVFCFFFKQKTAYEMRISDWSSDVCSSDLAWYVDILPDCYGCPTVDLRYLWLRSPTPKGKSAVAAAERSFRSIRRKSQEAYGDFWTEDQERYAGINRYLKANSSYG